MKAHQGDRIILAARHISEPTRGGKVLEFRGADGDPPYLVRWDDGCIGFIDPGPGAVLQVETEEQHMTNAPAERSEANPNGPDAAVVEPTLPHVREWQVRVSIFESGDDASANVVLITDAPTHMTARGQSHVRPGEKPVPEIGDEVAVARALRHLADQLLQTAAQDIEGVSGEVAQILPV